MHPPNFDWLDEHIHNPNHNEVFVGYTSHSRNKLESTNVGHFVGYRKGEPFFTLKFRDSVKRGRVSAQVWSHMKSVNTLFDSVHKEISGPPLILIPNKYAVEWLQNGVFKNFRRGTDEVAKMWFYSMAYSPIFNHYSATSIPFAILRELSLADVQSVASKVVEKSFYNYSEFDIE